MKYIINTGLLLIFFGSISCNRSDTIIGLNQNIHHDDFEYRVTSVEKRDSIVSDTGIMAPKGMFLIVTFTVENNALRVGHSWNNNIAYIESESGARFENRVTGQQLLNALEPFQWQEQYLTAHGDTQSTRLVFDVPRNITRPCLLVRGETLMGDVANFNRFKRIKIKLF